MKDGNKGATFLALMRKFFKASGLCLFAVAGFLPAQAASITMSCTVAPLFHEGDPGKATCTVSNPFQNDVKLTPVSVDIVFANFGESDDWAGNGRFDPTSNCFTAGLAKTKPGNPMSTCQANILFDTDEAPPQGKPETSPEDSDFGAWWLRASISGVFTNGRTGNAGQGSNFNLNSNPINNGNMIIVADVPEPSTAVLFVLGTLLVAAGSRRVRRKPADQVP